MGCKCTKSAESNNLNLQENENNPQNQDDIGNFIENTDNTKKQEENREEANNPINPNANANQNLNQNPSGNNLRADDISQSNFTKNKKSKKSVPLINQESEGKFLRNFLRIYF